MQKKTVSLEIREEYLIILENEYQRLKKENRKLRWTLESIRIAHTETKRFLS